MSVHAQRPKCYKIVIRKLQNISGLSTKNFQKYPKNTAIHYLCYKHKHTQIAPKTRTYRFLLYKYNYIGGSYLEITTGPDSVWSDKPIVASAFKGNII